MKKYTCDICGKSVETFISNFGMKECEECYSVRFLSDDDIAIEIQKTMVNMLSRPRVTGGYFIGPRKIPYKQTNFQTKKN